MGLRAQAKSRARARLEAFRMWTQSRRLSQVDSAPAAATAEALKDLRRHVCTMEEARRLSSVEHLRQGLLASDEVLSATSGGAVSRENVRDVARVSSVPEAKAMLLFRLVRRWRPLSGLELGSCLGVSGAYQGTAMSLNGEGSLVTVEGSPARAAYAERGLKGLGLDNTRVVSGLFLDVLPTLLPRIAPIDYVFVDGHHDGQATIDYYEMILPFLAAQSVVVFDDIRWSEGMRRASAEIRARPDASATVDRRQVGILIVDRALTGPALHV